ncbi:DMT family transporter [Thalassobius sp. I31.1]|uniref:DMT family transporter n=1 Tax=Thalassobius sp. I31.1 TaxID=2109912 RepID=UPI000D1B3131|nr:DMT family transporter [Thalassobius sp. I31.1]
MTPTTFYASIMLAAGIGIPVLASLNARLGQHLGSPAAAGFILFIVALTSTACVMMLTSGPSVLKLAPTAPKHLFMAGFLVTFYLLSITWIAPKFGVGNAVFFVLLGQMVSAAAIDHWGLFGAQTSPLTFTRALGVGTMALGVWITQLGR